MRKGRRPFAGCRAATTRASRESGRSSRRDRPCRGRRVRRRPCAAPHLGDHDQQVAVASSTISRILASPLRGATLARFAASRRCPGGSCPIIRTRSASSSTSTAPLPRAHRTACACLERVDRRSASGSACSSHTERTHSLSVFRELLHDRIVRVVLAGQLMCKRRWCLDSRLCSACDGAEQFPRRGRLPRGRCAAM